MYLSADQLALANQTALDTFEQCSIAWQAIPHWDTGDPGQTKVRNDVLNNPALLDLVDKRQAFQLTLAQTSAPTPDSLLTEVMASTTKLAKAVDKIVLQKLYDSAKGSQIEIAEADKLKEILTKLIRARADIEDDGYRAPSCLITNTAGLETLSELVGGYPATEGVLAAVNVNSLHRATIIDSGLTGVVRRIFILLGRRQLIPHGGAPDASPGEEPVDLAVSVLPSLEVVGETATGKIELGVRIRFATRVKDPKGIFALYQKKPTP